MNTYLDIYHRAREYTLNKYGRLFPYCQEGAGTAVRMGREHGVNLTRVCGFYAGNTHWWTVTEDGTIIDPTFNQFTPIGAGVHTPSDKAYRPYEQVPSEYRDMLGTRSGWEYQNWCKIKTLLKAGIPVTERRGQDLVEERIAKDGQKYLFIGREVYFNLRSDPQVRSILVFEQKKTSRASHMLFVNHQCRFVKDGQAAYPVWQRRVYVMRDSGWWIERCGGKTATLDIDTLSLVDMHLREAGIADPRPKLGSFAYYPVKNKA